MTELNAEDKGYLNGVFYFSNNDKEDFVVLWNNKEYTFPAKTCSPMIIMGETPENVQEIRKKFAYKWAEKMWYKGAEYKKMAKMGNGLPPIRDDKTLEPLVDMCLNPLPIEKAKVVEKARVKPNLKGSKAVKENDDLNATFKEENEILLSKNAS
jgi:hypothetical protein